MKRRFLFFTSVAAVAAASCFVAVTHAESKDTEKKILRMEQLMKEIPDSLFQDVNLEDLLNDEVYLKLAHDGWSPREIMTIMETAVKDKKKAKEKFGYGYYAKQWRPTYGRSLGDDPLYQFVDSGMPVATLAAVIEAVGENDYNATWPVEYYDPQARKRDGYVRRPGYFRQIKFNPSSGRTHWIVANQANDKGDELYVIPDNAGIFSTKDGGATWRCITDNIPDRANRSQSPGYSLPVDPYNWNHLFAFMANSSVYETTDGGDTWRRISGATHKNFKRGYCFRDTEGTLRFIGAQPNGNSGKLWISQDTCKTWTEIPVPKDFIEPINNNFWFQQIAFPSGNPDLILIPGSRSILYMDDGGRGQIVNGTRTYTLKRMKLNIGGTDNGGNVRNLTDQDCFPIDADSPGFLEVNPQWSDMMFFATGNRADNRTALYYTEDGGKNWETLQETLYTDDQSRPEVLNKNFGEGRLFGNEAPWNWLGGFGVQYNPENPRQKPQNIFACTMSSAYSTDGGHKFTEYAWGMRQKSLIKEGLTNPSGASNPEGYYYVTASRHNADNHCIYSHKSGKVFRGGDGGFFVHDPALSGEGKAVGAADWVNISSNMGQMLFYNIRCNEFGDQAIIGNLQDIDVQTYRYGRWGHWRGYEGSESSFNPYTSTGYMSGGGGGYSPEGMNPDSWNTARNYADVVTGAWFMLRTWSGDNTRSTLYRIDDIGRSLTDLYGAIGARVVNVALARDKGRLTVFVKTADNVIRMSTDSCKTFTPLVAYNGKPAAFSNTQMVCDPDDSNVLYLGQSGGKVWKYTVDDGYFVAHGSGLPANITCNRLFFHEGSGDLYFCDFSTGIYILKNGESQWRFWTRGYNNAKFNDCDINYTTQEMVLSDYGRGAWVADLETPSDRYFKDGFKLREISHRDGVRMFGIDTEWTIPMYYNYKWFVNGKEVKNPYQYLIVKDGETVNDIQLKLTLREAPDVSTLSALYQPEGMSESVPIDRHQGNALYSSGQGRVDIGYMDWFYDDFTVDMWIRPSSDGVIMSNSQLTVQKGAKGWVLYSDNGILKFRYYPSNQIDQPTYEVPMVQNPEVTGAPLARDKWSHVAVTQQRHGNISLYINGELVVSAPRQRADEPHTLNNSVIMSLFGDSFEHNPIEACVDELKIWKKALTIDEIRREMFSTNLVGDVALGTHYDFNGETLGDNRETFTGYIPASRTRAVTESRRMTVPVSADYVSSTTLLEGTNELVSVNGGMPLVDIEAKGQLAGLQALAYAYEGNRWENPDDNLSEAYYDPTQYGYMLRVFGQLDPDAKADVVFHNGNEDFTQGVAYRMYMADNDQDRMYWKQYKGKIVYEGGNLRLPDVVLADIVDRKLLLVTMKPAIEMDIEGMSADGRIILYDDGNDKTKYNFTARLIADKQLSDNRYEIMSDSAVVILPAVPLSFDNNREAKGVMEIDTDLIGDFNNTISTFIRGKNDDDMIPIPVDILNRITPKSLNHPLQISKGCVRLGSAADFSWLKGANNVTMMGWVRIDDEATITTGRNGDGYAPLIFFRSTSGNPSATGINLYKGNLGYHWNDQSWNYGARTDFNITKEDLGKWVHVALVVKPEGAWLYFNGMEQKMPNIPQAGMAGCNAESPLLLGTNTQGNYTYFSGAFDHVALWNRALSHEEIQKYMQNRVLLNDPELKVYLTMDEMDDAGRYKESVSGITTNNHYGSVSTGDATPVPFTPFATVADLSSAESPVNLSSGAKGMVTTFEGTPYNYIPAGTTEQQYLPLNPYFYTVIFNTITKSPAGDVTLTYNSEGLVDGETVAVGIRDLGSTVPFQNYITASSVNRGKATFTVPASRLAKSSELMFFSTPESSHRPTIVRMGFKQPGLSNGDTYLVADNSNHIDVNITVVSGNDEVHIVPTESYVSVNRTDVDMSDPSQSVTLTIDTDQLRKSNPFGLSDVTLNLEGTTAEPLTLRVGLKPRVDLKLKNGTDATHFTAKSPVSTMDIEATLIEGYLDGNVDLRFSPESLNSAFSINSGSLLLDTPVTISGLKLGKANVQGDLSQGWNVIGNPYLMNINLTKHQNYSYEDGTMTRFIYHTVEGSDNIFAYDMMDYDGTQKVLPFQSYYVQTMEPDAAFTVTEIAKEQALSRKTFDYYLPEHVRVATLALLDENDNLIDRTTVRWNYGTDYGYVLNEDAPKLPSANGTSDELYTLANNVPLSINTVPFANEMQVPVNVDVVNPGAKKLVIEKLSGFYKDLDADNPSTLYLVDSHASRQTELHQGDVYEFDADEPGSLDRFSLLPVFTDGTITSVDEMGITDYGYRIYTEPNLVRVTGLRGNAVVDIFNLSGMRMAHKATSDQEYSTQIEGGVYVVRITEDGNEFVSKIFVK